MPRRRRSGTTPRSRGTARARARAWSCRRPIAPRTSTRSPGAISRSTPSRRPPRVGDPVVVAADVRPVRAHAAQLDRGRRMSRRRRCGRRPAARYARRHLIGHGTRDALGARPRETQRARRRAASRRRPRRSPAERGRARRRSARRCGRTRAAAPQPRGSPPRRTRRRRPSRQMRPRSPRPERASPRASLRADGVDAPATRLRSIERDEHVE